MGFGIRIRALWHLRIGVAASFALAVVAAVWSVQSISLSPFSLTPRSFEMASATTHVVVDTPRSVLLDLRQDTYSLEALTNRAVLLGNVMASDPVRQSIERRARVPGGALRIEAPLTPEQPRPQLDTGGQKSATDIFALSDQYRLSIQANPSVPMLDIYSQSSSKETAEALANAAVRELDVYLAARARAEKTPAPDRIRLLQLGEARGTVINGGIRWQVALLTFVLVFVVACATVLFISRARQGWHLASQFERPATG